MTQERKVTTLAVGDEVILDKEHFDLTQLEHDFCWEYIKDFDVTKAMLRAGYSESYSQQAAGRILMRQNIKDAITFLTRVSNVPVVVSQEWVLRQLKDLAEDAISNGKYSAANKSLELLAKSMGMLTDKVDLTSDGEKMEVQAQVMYFGDKKIEF